MTIIEKYNQRADAINSLVCVGLDPDMAKLPGRFGNVPMPQFAFNKEIIDATHEYVSAYKPNIAFYESRGDEGIKELKLTLEYLQKNHPDIVTICDAKRGDIANTNAEYAKQFFEWFGFDAVTVHPYMGYESLVPFLERKDKACIVLCRTSNSGAKDFQDLIVEGKPLWEYIANKVAVDWNKNGNCMLAVGATYPEEMKKIRAVTGDMTFLVPGVGAQKGEVDIAIKAGINSHKKGMIVNSSRGIIFAEDPGAAARELRDAINAARA